MKNNIDEEIKLLSKKVNEIKTSKDEVLIGVKGLLTGTVLSLIKANDLSLKDNLDLGYYYEIDNITKEITEGKLPEMGNWLAGFYFNSALMRLAATYNILLIRMLGKSKGDMRYLQEEAIKRNKIDKKEAELLENVYLDVNDFEHEGGKFLKKRRTKEIATAIKAGNKLIELLNR